MEPDEINTIFEKIKENASHEYIDKQLDGLSPDDLYILANKILDSFFRFKSYALVSIVARLFDDTPEFCKLIFKFLEENRPDLNRETLYNPLVEKVSEKLNQGFSLVKSMLYLGDPPGVSSGILLSLLLGKIEELEKFMIDGLYSKDVSWQRCSMITLHTLLHDIGIREKKKYLDILKKIAPDILQENTHFLILCLQRSFEENADEFRPILKSELIRRGPDAASSYIRFTTAEKASISLLQKAVEILESEDPDSELIDFGLAKIYGSNPDFVVKRIKERLLKRDTIKLMDDYLRIEIQKIGIEPVLNMLESQIDEGNPTLLYFGENILGDLFPSQEDWMAWCEKWCDDERKERVILNSLGMILTKLLDYNPSETRDRAVNLVKVFSEKKGIDYEKETKGISLKNDLYEGWENKENAIKGLKVLEIILSPEVKIDVEILTNNLKKAPHLSKAIGAQWLISKASSDNPHILVYIFNEKSDEDEKLLPYQLYWENVFLTLEEHGIRISKSKSRDVDNAKNILAEAEVLSRLAPFFEITIEPDIEELRPKKLEALIKFEGEEALIEVRAVKERWEVLLARGGSYIPGGKIKNVLLDKFKEQLNEGKSNPKIPILLILKLDDFIDSYEVLNGIYGESLVSMRIRKETHEIVEEGTTRKENGFYDEEGSNIVTAIGAYKRDLYKQDPLVGKIYRPFKAPVNKMSQKFYLRIRNALFGKSETSDWKSLMWIYGVDEQMANLLYSRGIEDLGALAEIHGDEFVVEGVPWEELSQLRDEARRVIKVISKGSVRFLKGMNQETFDILQKVGIYLIKDILEKRTPPEGISPDVWALITEDAKRVSKGCQRGALPDSYN